VNGSGLIGDSEAALRFFGKGVVGRSGIANVGSAVLASLAGDVVDAEALLLRFLVASDGAFFFSYKAPVGFGGFGVAEALLVILRAERRRDAMADCVGREARNYRMAWKR
jgi:hypothetical protein